MVVRIAADRAPLPDTRATGISGKPDRQRGSDRSTSVRLAERQELATIKDAIACAPGVKKSMQTQALAIDPRGPYAAATVICIDRWDVRCTRTVRQ